MSTETAGVKEACAAGDVPFDSLEPVRDGVYRGRLTNGHLGDSKTAFVKMYEEDRVEQLRTFVPLAAEVGHTPCVLVEEEYICLVMAPASGRPLSRLLPIVFVPGVWRMRRDRYVDAFEQIGRQFGRLHTKTERDTGPVLRDDERERALDITASLEDEFQERMLDRISACIERSEDYESPYALTYGDRSPHNMYFDGSDAQQIDAGCKYRSTVYEHSGVIVGVELMARRLPYGREQYAGTLSQAYWSGYESVVPWSARDGTHLDFRRLYKYLKLLELYNSNPTSLNSKLTQFVDPPILRDSITTIVEEQQD